MLSAYERRLLAFYLINAASRLHYRDHEASNLAEWVADRANGVSTFGTMGERSCASDMDPDSENGNFARKWRDLQLTLRAEHAATGRACSCCLARSTWTGASVCESTGVVHCGRCQGPAVAPRRQPTGRGIADSLHMHVSRAPRCCVVPRCESIRFEATDLDRASIPVMHAQGAVGARYAPRGSRDRARPSSTGSGVAVPQA